MFIKRQAVNQNSRRIWGKFKMSNGETVHFEMLRGESWFQWGASTETLCVTMPIVENLCNNWLGY